jgi:hypothetical protein
MADELQLSPPRGKRKLPAIAKTKRVQVRLCQRHLEKLQQLCEPTKGKRLGRSRMLRKMVEQWPDQQVQSTPGTR